MREMINMVVVLTVLSAFSGGLLAALKDGTKERIENQELSLVKGPAVKTILKGSSNDPVDTRFKIKVGDTDHTVFVGVFDGKANTVAFETTGNGFADKLGLMVGFNVDTDTLIGVNVTTIKDTPGLGANAKEDTKWAAQFSGKSLDQPFKVTNDGGEINAISGATITSRGVCAAATDAVALYKEIKPELLSKLKEVKP